LTRSRDRASRPGKLTEPQGKRRPPAEPEAAPFSITLRDIEIAPQPMTTDMPAGEELVVSDPEARPAPWLGDPEAERAAQRAARRAQVRKDRLRDDAPEEGLAPATDPLSPALPTVPAAPTAPVAPGAVVDVPRGARTEAARSEVAPTNARATNPAAAPVAIPGSVANPAPVATPAPVAVAAPVVAPATSAKSAKSPAAPAPVSSTKPVANIASPTAAPPVTAASPVILLLRPAGAATDPLGDQLKAFGFAVLGRTDLPDLPAPWPFVAVFVDLALRPADGGDAIDLCNDVRERSRLPGVLKPVLVLVADQLTPTNRVRAGLAGCNEILLGAITRGSVAKVLDTRGIKLPSDARRT